MTSSKDSSWLQSFIRDVPDYPKPGILFKDISPLLRDPNAFKRLIELLALELRGRSIDQVIGIEARGFVLGSALALYLGVGFVMVRKHGKLPWKTLRHTYALEYGEDTIEMHEDALKPKERIVIVDDVLATGGTALAAALLCKKLDAEIVQILLLLELVALKGREKLKAYDVKSLISVH